jgi:polysaccharide biosynthesis/export protein
MIKIIKLVSLICFVVLILDACTVNSHIMLKTPKNYVFNELDPNNNKTEYEIAINDVIVFQLYTNNGFQLIDMFNQNSNNNQQSRTMLMGGSGNVGIQYMIRQDSLVELPILGEVSLVGKTIKEAEIFLETQFSEFYVDPFINININSRRVFMFTGSGGDAQVLPLTYNNMTLFEALAMAGGIGQNGKAKKIKLIRPTEIEPEIYLIDLSTIDGIRNGNMVLQSHDIIYVTPNPNYASEILTDIGPVLSLISSLTLTWATYLNLIQ